MKYTTVDAPAREQLLRDLLEMPGFIERAFSALPDDLVTRSDSQGGFSPVEHCFHLADLEREGYGVRIRRLLSETEPRLPDFDGGRLAEERHYKTRPISEAITAFWTARLANLAAFRAMSTEDWARGGLQDGVGPIALCDLPTMMAEHDSVHRAEIEAWRRSVGA